ncbi:MAG: trehalose-phosphatase [Bradyrhizobium sp.]
MPNVIPDQDIDLVDFAILLDIDGTLLDFAATPREVWVPPSLRRTLSALWEGSGGAVALVSGRSLDDLDLIFAPLQLPAIGGPGAEFRPFLGADPQRDRTPALDKILKRKLAAVAELGPGILLEDKGYSLALHYRLAPEKGPAVHAAVMEICAKLPPGTVEILPGKAVVEVKQVGFTKATAVVELMALPPFAGRRPVFVGDDTTDEPVFEVLPAFGGIGFSVGRRVEAADGCFDQPKDVRAWLDGILQRHMEQAGG